MSQKAESGLHYDSARRPIKTNEPPKEGGSFVFRRRAESNRRMKVLQTSPLPLGYGARILTELKTISCAVFGACCVERIYRKRNAL